MDDKLIVGLIVLIVLFAHWWIFQWVRFKVDETVVLKHIKSTTTPNNLSVQLIATTVNLSEKRVLKICKNSKDAKLNVVYSTNHLN